MEKFLQFATKPNEENMHVCWDNSKSTTQIPTLPFEITGSQRVNHSWSDQGKRSIHFDGLVLDCSNFIANALELLQSCTKSSIWPRGRFKYAYKLINLRALEVSHLNRLHIFHCKGKIFSIEFQRVPLKFRTKYLTNTLKDAIFIQYWKFETSQI